MNDTAEKTDEKKTAEEKTDVPELPPLTAVEKEALFVSYEKMSAEIETLEVRIKTVREQMSVHVKGLVDRLKKNGPFIFKGKEYVASRRNETWFFRVRAQNEGVEVIG